VAGLWFSLGTPISSTNKTNHHDLTEIVLKVTFYTVILKHKLCMSLSTYHELTVRIQLDLHFQRRHLMPFSFFILKEIYRLIIYLERRIIKEKGKEEIF
jgi:hypothetical protein